MVHGHVDHQSQYDTLQEGIERAKKAEDDNPFLGSVKVLALGRTDGAVMAWFFHNVG